jgi:hypothetical protein
VRTEYETVIGIPSSASTDVRPASGYVVHKDWQAVSDTKRTKRAKDGNVSEERVENIQTDVTAFGSVYIYGQVTMRLKPEVSERTRYGWGDSFNNMIDPVPMSKDADTDDITNALLSRRFKNGGREENINGILQFLDGHLENDFGRMRNKSDSSGGGATLTTSDYAEALILGSFELEDIEEIEMDGSSRPWLPSKFFPQKEYNVYTEENAREFADSMQKLFDDTMSTEMLRDAGATDEELAVIQEWLDNYIESTIQNSSPTLPNSGYPPFGYTDLKPRINAYLTMLSQQELRTTAQSKGIKLKLTDDYGRDKWDITQYVESDQSIGDILEIWRVRVARAAVADARTQIEIRNRPRSTAMADF